MIDFDYLLSKIGYLGRYQIMVILMIYYFGIPSGFNAIGPVFMSYAPDYRCYLPAYDDGENCTCLENEEILEKTTPYDSDEEKYDTCQRYVFNSTDCDCNLSCPINSTSSIDCDSGYYYDRSLFTETAVTEFDLVCDKLIWSAIATSMYMVGVLLGSFIFGNVSDIIGRKLTLVLTTIGSFVGMVGAALSHQYWLYVFSRVLVSFFGFGVTLSGFVFVMEVIGEQYRTLVGIAFQAAFAIGYMLLSGLAYQWRDWHDMQWACIVVSLPFGLFLFVIPESPRWLFTREKEHEGRKITERIAKFNKAPLTEEMWSEAERIGNKKMKKQKESSEEKRRFTSTDLFRTRGIRIITFQVMFNWFVNSLVYYGVSLNTGALSGDIFINNVLGGVMEIASYTICILTMEYLGRRLLLAIMLLLAGLTLLSCAIVYEYAGDDEVLITLGSVFAFIGKFGISGSYAIIYNFTTELYPTVVRSNGVGIGSVAARFGGILAPFIIASQYTISWLPNTIFGIFSVIGGLVAFKFPETTGIRLLETIEEAEMFYQGKNYGNITESERSRSEEKNSGISNVEFEIEESDISTVL